MFHEIHPQCGCGESLRDDDEQTGVWTEICAEAPAGKSEEDGPVGQFQHDTGIGIEDGEKCGAETDTHWPDGERVSGTCSF